MFGRKNKENVSVQVPDQKVKPKKKRGCLTTVLIVFIALVAISVLVPSGSEQDSGNSQGAQASATTSASAGASSELSAEPAASNDAQVSEVEPEPEQKPAAKTKKEKAFENGAVVDWVTVQQEYKDNAISADNAYKGKNLIVTGEVFDIGREVMQHPYVTFSSDGYIGTFQMVFNNDEESLIAGLSKGDTITVVGECKGESLGVIILLDNCYLQVDE